MTFFKIIKKKNNTVETKKTNKKKNTHKLMI